MTPAPSTRSPVVRGKLMRTAERLYAERGFAGVSIRQIGEAAGQRNKTAVQYHFTSRDELIKTILTEHAGAVERHRFAMVEALGPPAEVTLADQVACVILPTIEHHIELGTPSWYGRFLAQALVDPQLREHTVGIHLYSPSLRRLKELGHLDWGNGAVEQLNTMIRQLSVHMCAELEHDLSATGAAAEPAWRQLGDDLTRAVCGIVRELLTPG
jgi:AcrR family transcriptional regulator